MFRAGWWQGVAGLGDQMCQDATLAMLRSIINHHARNICAKVKAAKKKKWTRPGWAWLDQGVYGVLYVCMYVDQKDTSCHPSAGRLGRGGVVWWCGDVVGGGHAGNRRGNLLLRTYVESVTSLCRFPNRVEGNLAFVIKCTRLRIDALWAPQSVS
jgi:hypothetical protein